MRSTVWSSICHCLYKQETHVDSTNYKDIPQHVDFSEESDDVYNTNIQIAELNAINATMAVIKWKQYFKVYMDNNRKQQAIYVIEEGEIAHED